MFLKTICSFGVVLLVCHVEGGSVSFTTTTPPNTPPPTSTGTTFSTSTTTIPPSTATTTLPTTSPPTSTGTTFSTSTTTIPPSTATTTLPTTSPPTSTGTTFSTSTTTIPPSTATTTLPTTSPPTSTGTTFSTSTTTIPPSTATTTLPTTSPPTSTGTTFSTSTTTIPPSTATTTLPTTSPPTSTGTTFSTSTTTIPPSTAIPLAFTANARTCVKESLTPLVIRIRRPSSDTLAMNASVTYSDLDADSTSDYLDSVTTLAFQDGERNAYLEVPITDDLVIESTEEFSITISAPGYDNITIKGCIRDDDRAVRFDCTRYGVTCDAGTCPAGGPKCDCSTAPGRTGDDCGIIEANINGTGCASIDCGRRGRCVSNGTVGACVCDSGYYSGDEGKCELKRTIITSCDNNMMTICMNPINIYRPLITVSGYTSNRCTADLVGYITDNRDRIPSDIQGQCLNVPFSGPCGTYTATPQDGNVCYTIPYRIQYNPNLMAASDEVVYAKCCVNQAGQTISTDEILADTATQFLNKQQEAINFLGVRLSSRLNNGYPIESPLPLNQIYQLCLDITDDGFAYLGLIRIIVHNGRRGYSRQEAVVFGNDGCSDEAGKSIVHTYPRRVSDTRICMRYKPGYFRPGPAAVTHDITYRLCLAGDQASCQLTQCGANSIRKKRQTNTGGVEATANATVYFEDESPTGTEAEVSPLAKDCEMEMSVVFPAIIVVCVIALLLIAVIMFMCFLLMKKRGKQEDKLDDLKSEKSHKSYPCRY